MYDSLLYIKFDFIFFFFTFLNFVYFFRIFNYYFPGFDFFFSNYLAVKLVKTSLVVEVRKHLKLFLAFLHILVFFLRPTLR